MRQHNITPPEPDPVARIDAEARLYGARIATRCSVCGRWLVAPKSRAAHVGPKCQKGSME
ncbi:DUF6011 domain-containing protein [Rhodococcus pyridinivorans]|uniref:DUF6011 domain-containing protein n=1 Tax=Rhodococcus pyridinivorans TaxID=103816 RepID=UPI0020C60B11|nr:DUF6011 domain-containing protein [Rhodococcus pyridinivorans]UTM37298.1 DUF6011 domain-containing protein [Rhodococcus pyridinivorans]